MREKAGAGVESEQRVLAGWLSWVECHPVHQKAENVIPSHCTHLGCGFGPWSGRIQNAADQCFSLTLMFLSLSFSLRYSRPAACPLSLKSTKTYPQVRIFFKK